MGRPFDTVTTSKLEEIDAACFDIQLVSDELAADDLFTVEQSVPGKDDKKRWCSLSERLAADEIVRVRRFISRFMEIVTSPDSHWVWFTEGVKIVDEPTRPE